MGRIPLAAMVWAVLGWAQAAHCGPAVDVEALIRALGSRDASARLAASDKLSEVPSRLARSHARLLRRVATRGEPVVRVRAAGLLARLDWAELAPAVRVLAAALRDPDQAESAAEALGRIGPDGRGAVPALIALARKGPPGPAASAAVEALGRIGPGARSGLMGLVGLGRDCRTRAARAADGNVAASYRDLAGRIDSAVAKIEGTFEGKSAADWAAQAGGEDQTARPPAIRALGSIGQAAVSELCKLLEHEDRGVRASVARTLADMGRAARSAVPALVKALSDGDAQVRCVSSRALGSIAGELRAADVLHEMDRHVRPAAEPLVRLLTDPDKEVRENAATATEQLGCYAVGPLVDVINRADASVRSEAGSVLAGIAVLAGPGESKLVVSGLVRALSHSDPHVRRRAIDGLKCLGPRASAAAGALRRALKDPDEKVRREADKALSIIRPDR